ncbi:hypothetical protein K9N68_34750 (plasmid) [Kovacikia minuta CCNUW1]|nr:hypothetical protein [Kovacikia minuta]UBF30366.1 hypothetical protein K9N68_34750 [Kovacikia minuta CCNUW1]
MFINFTGSLMIALLLSLGAMTFISTAIVSSQSSLASCDPPPDSKKPPKK